MEKSVSPPNEFDEKAAVWDEDPKKVALAEAIATNLLSSCDFEEACVLDYGCATGMITVPLAKVARNVLAVDTSVEMVRMLNTKVKKLGINNLSCIGLEEYAQQETPAYDIIVSSMVLHHIEDIPRQLACFSAWLRPKGQLLVVDLELEDDTFHQEGAAAHPGFEPEQLVQMVHDVGFTRIQTRQIYTFHRLNRHGKPQDYDLFLLQAHKR